MAPASTYLELTTATVSTAGRVTTVRRISMNVSIRLAKIMAPASTYLELTTATVSTAGLVTCVKTM